MCQRIFLKYFSTRYPAMKGEINQLVLELPINLVIHTVSVLFRMKRLFRMHLHDKINFISMGEFLKNF